MKVELGDEIKCKITGYKGIAISRLEHINGCVQIGMKPQNSKGDSYPETIYLDIEFLKVIKQAKIVLESRPTGGNENRNLKMGR